MTGNRSHYLLGHSLLELIIAVCLMSSIMIGVLGTLGVLKGSWIENYDQTRLSSELKKDIRELQTRLKHAKSIDLISLSSNTTGYLTYTDANDISVSVFYNSSSNQSTLSLSNSLPTDALVAAYHDNSVLLGIDVLIDTISSFTLNSYKDDSGSDLFVLNNTSSPSYELINSIKWILSKTIDNKSKSQEQLITLVQHELSNDSSVRHGDSSTTFYGNTTLTNLSVQSDTTGGGDQVYVTPDTGVVTIQNTGQYYSTINDAINAASAGDVILVSAGTYYENVLLKSDITLLGGYESTNWTRNIHENLTTVVNPGTGNAGTFYGYYDNNVVIDGFFIDSGDQSNGIGVYSYVCSNITVRNCWVDDNPNVGVYIYKGSATLQNLTVTANTNTFQVYQVTSTTTVERCRFYSLETSWCQNVYLRNSQNITFRNNIVLNGDYGIKIESCTSGININNNLFQEFDSYAIYMYYSNYVYFRNNIFDNYYQLMYSYYSLYNYFYNTGLSNYLYSGNYFYPSSYSSYHTFYNTFYPYGSGYFESDYQLTGSTNYDNPYIDGGYLYSNNDEDNTQKGTSTNDCGAYGGPYAGRVGVGKKHLFTTSSSDIASDIANNTYAGDHILLAKGSYSPSQIQLKKYRFLYGAGAQQSILTNSLSTPLITMNKHSHLEGVTITGSGKDGVQSVSYESGMLITKTLFRDLSTAVSVADYSSPTLRYCSWDNVTTGISASYGTTMISEYNIFHGGTTGISVYDYYDISRYSVFYNLSTDTSGYISSSNDTSVTSSDNLFWSTADNQHQLYDRAGNPAVDIYLNREAGCFPYYEKTATIASSVLTSAIARDYDTLTMTLIPDSDFPVSKFSLSVKSGASTLSISPDVELTSASTTSYVWTLPESVITAALEFSIDVTTYTFGHSPIIDQIDTNY
ncbi:MAG: right-handed parallel beta-helix repeat-containing protein [bacterium]